MSEVAQSRTVDEHERLGVSVEVPVDEVDRLVRDARLTGSRSVRILARQYEDGTVEADVRADRGSWVPVQIYGGSVEKVEV